MTARLRGPCVVVAVIFVVYLLTQDKSRTTFRFGLAANTSVESLITENAISQVALTTVGEQSIEDITTLSTSSFTQKSEILRTNLGGERGDDTGAVRKSLISKSQIVDDAARLNKQNAKRVNGSQGDPLKHNSDIVLDAVSTRDPIGTCSLVPNKRIIFAATDEGNFELTTNWHKSAMAVFPNAFNQIVILAETSKAEALLLKLQAKVGRANLEILSVNYAFLGKGRKGSSRRLEHLYNSKEFGALMKRRPDHLLNFLGANCSVLFSDVDAMFRKPLEPVLLSLGRHEMYMTSNTCVEKKKGLKLCGCFMYLHPQPRVKQFIQLWKNSIGALFKNQPALNAAMKKMQNVLDFVIFPKNLVPPGCMKSLDAIWAHANFRSGLAAKVEFLKYYGADL